MYPLLALDVATGSACACVINAEGKAWTAQASDGKQHSHTVLPLLQGVLQQAGLTWSDLRMLVSGQGPGSFTGLRIGAATLAGINASLKLPIWGLSSLAITAMQIQNEHPVWVLEDARANEVFVACYQAGECLQEDSCKGWQDVALMTASQFVAQQDPAIDLASWQRLPLSIDRAHAMSLLIQARSGQININALTRWIQPVYLQLSQAERNLQHA
ncbi:MAG: tRNA (adenosine(37)-N6)-threonylcarbamoyltransferase complex dimerization subunit type 1 TsaB [Mariprofundaceae bacterium]|nr:tRNA (adenosine(37)-N6)-threonylcarbamoyltransferase complex dimerization subunit type 1 TsaB [Mariprofundaceae bacterium]